MSLAPLLEATLSHDHRESAEAQLTEYAEQSFPSYAGMLCQELTNGENAFPIRQAAGIALKNALTAKEYQRKEVLANRWIETDDNTKAAIRGVVLQTLAGENSRVGYVAAQIIQAIAAIELPRGEWQELIPTMLENVTKSDNTKLKEASLQALGLICEAVDPDVLQQYANSILTAVVSGARKEEPSPAVQKAALSALYNSLDFVKQNFEAEVERNYIMTIVCEATRIEVAEIQVVAFECLVKIMSSYYQHMNEYMEKALGSLTLWGMRHEQEEIVLQAVEFWSTICEEEIELEAELEADDDEDSSIVNYHFAKKATPELVDALWWLMTKKEEEDDEDEWNVSMAAATCLSLLANASRDTIVEPVLQFVQTHIQSSDWRYKDASIMAFGSIMDGPNPELLEPLVVQALPLLIGMMKDPVLQIKDTTAWTLGRICEILPSAIKPEILPPFIEAILAGLQENPRVALNCAWALMSLGENLGVSDEDGDTYPLSIYFESIIRTLSAAGENHHQDPNYRASVYEAIGSLVTHCAKDCLPTVNKLAILILDRLEQTRAAQNQLVSADDRRLHAELQSNLCGAMTAVVRRLNKAVVPIADRTMENLLFIMTSGSKASTVMEDAFLTVSALTVALEGDFGRYMDSFSPFLHNSLQNHEEYQMCSIAVGLVGDISRALNEAMVPYCDGLMNTLLANLQNPLLNKLVKTSILAAFGDIALAIGGHFETYLVIVMAVLQQAGSMATVTVQSIQEQDYGNHLRESIVEAYVGIVQGLKASDKAMLLAPYTPQLFSFAQEIATSNAARSPQLTSALVGLLGDLAAALTPGQFKPLFSADWIASLLKSVKSDRNMDQDAKAVAKWAREMVRRQVSC
ncbi:karyopherin Kap95 [Phlyctochytrium arcticum]|nr:karyopherin Kap95 [Phlyctochytrium arcticum]